MQFTDNYEDTLEIETNRKEIYGRVAGDEVYVTVNERDLSAQVEFDPETAREVAIALYKAAGGNDDEGPVMASTISFNEGVIRLAAIHGKTVEFRYVKSSASPPETRRFVPTSVEGQGDNLRFVGRDTDREDFRSFRLDRIKGTVGVIA